MTSATIGLRNLARNRWRSGLTLGGIAVSVAFMVWILCFMEGWMFTMVRGATAVETGQVQIHTAAWAENPRVDRSFTLDAEMLRTLEALPDVEAVSPRIRLYGLVGHEEKSVVARIIAVDPAREAAATPVAEAVREGRWLAAEPADTGRPREAVLGEQVARQLRVDLGSELVVFFEAADGSLGNDLLEVVGIVRTGNSEVDRSSVYIHLADGQWLGALDGEVHELALRTQNLARARETAVVVAGAIGGITTGAPPPHDPEATLLVEPWQTLLPAIDQILRVSRQSYFFVYLLIYLVAAVGILNTQRMSALERRREFGVLMAIGMRPRRLFRMVVTESLVLGTVGGVLGTALGAAVTWWHATRGMDIARYTGEGGFTYMGVSFSDRIYAVLSPELVVQPVAVMVAVALLVGLWPALTTARIDPAPTIAGRF